MYKLSIKNRIPNQKKKWTHSNKKHACVTSLLIIHLIILFISWQSSTGWRGKRKAQPLGGVARKRVASPEGRSSHHKEVSDI